VFHTLKVEIAGSNPARVTPKSISKPPAKGGFSLAQQAPGTSSGTSSRRQQRRNTYGRIAWSCRGPAGANDFGGRSVSDPTPTALVEQQEQIDGVDQDVARVTLIDGRVLRPSERYSTLIERLRSGADSPPDA